MKRFVMVVATATLAASMSPARAAAPHVVTASGPLAVLNGVAAIDIQAVAPFPLGIPAPAGHVTFAYQSTFEPPSPRAITIELWCTEVRPGANGLELFASGTGSDDADWFFHLAPPRTVPGLWSVSWSRTPASGPCGARPGSGAPLIGAAAIV